jgi:hypothetical protein
VKGAPDDQIDWVGGGRRQKKKRRRIRPTRDAGGVRQWGVKKCAQPAPYVGRVFWCASPRRLSTTYAGRRSRFLVCL